MFKIINKENLLSIVFVSLMIMIGFCCKSPSETIVAKAENENFIITQGMYDDYTDTDYLLNSTSQVITEYSTNLSLYKSSSNINVNDGVLNATILGDDTIVKIIPKELFMMVGDHLYIGKEYGFFVNTIAQSDNSNNRRITAMVFDITTNNDLIETVDNFIIGLTPIFQYEYVYLTEGESLFYISSMENKENHNRLVSYSITEPVVIPTAFVNSSGTTIVYEMVDKFYIKDICFTAQILNEQALNQNDSNYNSIQDNGTFFTAVDYSYNGISKFVIEPTTAQQVIFGLDTVSVALGITSLVVPDFGLLGLLSTVLSASSYAYNLTTTNYEILMQGQSDFEAINSGQLTTKRLYTTRSSQITQYGGLVKAAGVCVNSNGKDSIWYGTNSNATAYFTVSNTGDEYARYYREIGLQVVDKDGNQKSISNSIYQFSYGEPIAKEIRFEEAVPVYLLENGKNLFVFNAQYLSDYNISINATESVYLKVNNEIITGIDNVFNVRINAGENIPILVYGNVNAINTIIEINPSASLTNISIPANSSYILYYDNYTYNCKTFKTTNPQLNVENIFHMVNEVLQEYRFNGLGISSSVEITMPTSIGKKYLVIKNNTNSIQITNLLVDIVATLAQGTNANIGVGGVYTYYKFVVTEPSSFIMTFDFMDTSISKMIYDNNFVQKTSINSAKTMIVSDLVIGTYWIAYKNTLNSDVVMGEIIINPYDNAFKWIVDGSEVDGQDIALEIATTHDFALKVNNAEQITLLCVDEEYASVNTTGEITIKRENVTPGTKIEVEAYMDNTLLVKYAYKIEISCLHETKMSITGDINNQTTLAFSWRNKDSEIIAFKYRILENNNQEYEYNISNNLGSINILSKINPTVIYNTIKITHVKTASTNFLQYWGDATSEYKINTCFGGGDGSNNSPFVIYCVRHFNNIQYSSKANSPYNYLQTEHLYFENTAPTRNVDFYGYYDGNSKNIDQVVVANDNNEYVGGLFSTNYGTIKNHGIIIVTIEATYYNGKVGGIVGRNYGTIITGLTIGVTITSYNYNGSTGGIVGVNETNGNITCGIIGGTINAKGNIGSFVGVNNGAVIGGSSNITINYYYYITTSRSIGGLVGINNGTLTGPCGYYSKIYYKGKTSSAKSLTIVSSTSSTALRPRIGKIVGTNYGTVDGTLYYNSASINVGTLTPAQQEYVNLTGAIGK